MSPLSNYNSLEIPGNRGSVRERIRGIGTGGAGLTCDPEGAVIANDLLGLRHHGAAEPVATGAGLAASGVVRIIVETKGAVGTPDVRIFIPRVAVPWEAEEEWRRKREQGKLLFLQSGRCRGSELSNPMPSFLKLSSTCWSTGGHPCPGTNSKHGRGPASHPHSPMRSRHALPLLSSASRCAPAPPSPCLTHMSCPNTHPGLGPAFDLPT